MLPKILTGLGLLQVILILTRKTIHLPPVKNFWATLASLGPVIYRI